MRIKVITLNIWHGGIVWDGAIEFLRREDPDILLVQEVANEHNPSLPPRHRTVDVINELFDFVDSDFAGACKFVYDVGKVEEGNAIFSKFPIAKRYEPIFFNEPYNDNLTDSIENAPIAPRNLEHVVIDVDGTELDVLNLQGVWDLDGDADSPKRQHMRDVILEAIQGRPRLVLGGDTNFTPLNPILRPIEAQLTNVFKDELTTSFNVSRKDLVKFPGYATAVVDMLFVSPEIKVVEHSCPDVDASDHLPLVATLEII